jgi:UDP-N-acetyl-D-mannosaminuronate dehydrogenase
LALEVSRAGFNTIGFDVSAERVAQLNAGRSHITDVSDDDIGKAIAGGKYRATDDFAELGRCDVIVICVPTPLRKTKDPDISYIVSAMDGVPQHIRPPALIVLESTTYSGTTDELVVAELESVGLTLDQDFFACFSPERVDPGNALFQTRNIRKWSEASPNCPRSWVSRFTNKYWKKFIRSAQLGSRRWPNCWKIRFAPSTLAWSMNWRCWRNGWV